MRHVFGEEENIVIEFIVKLSFFCIIHGKSPKVILQKTEQIPAIYLSNSSVLRADFVMILSTNCQGYF